MASSRGNAAREVRPPAMHATPPTGLVARLRDGGRPLGALLLLAFGLKLLCVLAAVSDDPLAVTATSDGRYYLDRALALAGRGSDPEAGQPHHLPPLYPHLLRRVPGVLDESFTLLYLLQAAAGTLALGGVFALARRRMGRLAALAATAATLLYAPLTFFELKLLGDSLACSLLVLALVLADATSDALSAARRRQDDSRPGPEAPRARFAAGRAAGLAALLGALLATIALLRPQMLLLVPLGTLWLLLRRAPLAAGVLLAAAVLLLAPSTRHNLERGGGLRPVSDNGGVNLWLANTGPLSGTFLTHDEAFGDIERQAASARVVAERMAGRSLSPGEVADTLTRAAGAAVVAQPGLFLQRVGLRALALVEDFETDIVCVPEVESTLIGPLKLLPLPFGLLLALGAAGLVLGRGRTAPDAAGRGAAPVAPLLAVVAVVVATTLLFFHYSRFRLPLVPLLALAAAAGIERELLGRRAGRADMLRLGAALALGAALLALSHLPGRHHADTVAIGWTSLSEARLARAAPTERQAALLAAAADLERALAVAPGLVRAQLQDVRVSFGLQRYDDCAAALERVGRALPDHTQVLMNRAWLLALDVPTNTHVDLPAARALLARLRERATGEPELLAHLLPLEQQLAAAEARAAQRASH